MGRYQSPIHAALDAAAALWCRLRRQRLMFPRRCDTCGRTATTVPASRRVTAHGVDCRRITWRLRPCTGRLVKAATR